MAYGFLCGLSTMDRLSSDFFGMEESFLTQLKNFLARFFGLIISFFSIIITLVILLQSDGDNITTPCPNCAWLSCVPFPPWEDENNKWWYCDSCNRVSAEIVTQPNLHLAIDCPSGSVAEVDLSNHTRVDRDSLQKNLPTFCRAACLTEETSTARDRFLILN